VTAKTTITTIAERPDLVPVVADWIFQIFGRDENETFADIMQEVANSVSPCGPPQVFILLAGGKPAGTASLVAHDLGERPDLTPWLASVYVVPEARRRGFAAKLVAAVEDAALAASISTLFLYTNTAQSVYQRAGWQRIDTFEKNGRPTALMRRELAAF
jgi:GNAT superfamily N-acetyltransferase